MRRLHHFATAFLITVTVACDTVARQPVMKSGPTAKNNEVDSLHLADARKVRASKSTDEPLLSVLNEVRSFSKVEMPPADFAPAYADPIPHSELSIESTDDGYVVSFPSGTPIPKPTVDGSRIYVSGGFSSETFHCLDLETGNPIWEVRLDDDGPSTAAVCDDQILLGTESCTFFALHQQTGAMTWSAYLGDPLLSAPAAADGRVITVYPAVNDPPQLFSDLIHPGSHEVSPFASITSEEVDEQNPKVEDGAPSVSTKVSDLLEPTHIVICMEVASGKVIWRTWIDSDCMTCPVIDGDDVYIASLSGVLYQLSLGDGAVQSAWRASATSAPLVTDDSIYITRRLENEDGEVREQIAFLRRDNANQYLAAKSIRADYLKATVQMQAKLQDAASGYEQMNGFGGGGFGGGFGSGTGMFGGPGSFQIKDSSIQGNSGATEGDTISVDSKEETPSPEKGATAEIVEIDYSKIGDLLGYTEVQAAENIGVGSASTIQNFTGSLTVADDGQLYNTMGNQLVCTSRETGDESWKLNLEGDLEKLGGHLAAPPCLDDTDLFLATVSGAILRIDRESGRAVTLKQCDAQFRSQPVVTANTILVTTQDGRLFAINKRASTAASSSVTKSGSSE